MSNAEAPTAPKTITDLDVQPDKPATPDGGVPRPGPGTDVDAAVEQLLALTTGGNFVDTYTLEDPDTGDTLTVRHAVPSARRRIRFYELEDKRPVNRLRLAMTERMVAAAREAMSNGQDPEQFLAGEMDRFVFRAVLAGDLSLDALMGKDATTLEDRQEHARLTLEQFRTAVDDRQLTTDWKNRLGSDVFLGEQDVVEMERFVTSFRRRLDGRPVPSGKRPNVAGLSTGPGGQ